MTKSILERNGISEEAVGLVSRLVDSIPFPERRIAMGEVAVTILGGSHRLAESVFGWNRNSVRLGIHEFESGIRCVDNVSERRRKKVEEQNPRLLVDIQRLVDPHSHADCQLRTDLAHTNITAQAAHDGLGGERLGGRGAAHRAHDIQRAQSPSTLNSLKLRI